MTHLDLPDPPDVAGRHLGAGRTFLRYEDVTQDGRLRLEAVWPALGPILWTKMEIAGALHRLGEKGVRAVLSYVALEGSGQPLSVRAPCDHEVRWRLGQTVDDAGQPTRLILDTWLETTAPPGSPGNPGGPPLSEARAVVARAYGQHVFTRPAAPVGQHRVLGLDDAFFAGEMATTCELRDAARLLAMPPEAEPLEPVPRSDAAPIAFGLCHTDGNQHVNFLVYSRLAEEGALRRFAELGLDGPHLARRAEVAYRKPCFAGDVVRLVMQAFRIDGVPGIVAAFFADHEIASGRAGSFADLPKPCCVARLGF